MVPDGAGGPMRDPHRPLLHVDDYVVGGTFETRPRTIFPWEISRYVEVCWNRSGVHTISGPGNEFGLPIAPSTSSLSFALGLLHWQFGYGHLELTCLGWSSLRFSSPLCGDTTVMARLAVTRVENGYAGDDSLVQLTVGVSLVTVDGDLVFEGQRTSVCQRFGDARADVGRSVPRAAYDGPGTPADSVGGREVVTAPRLLLESDVANYRNLVWLSPTSDPSRPEVPTEFLLGVVLGLEGWSHEMREGMVALLGMERARFDRPALVGEELRVKTTIVNRRRSSSRPNRDVVTLGSACLVGDDTVARLERTALYER